MCAWLVQAGWQAGWLAAWLAGWLPGCLAGWLAAHLFRIVFVFISHFRNIEFSQALGLKTAIILRKIDVFEM